MSKKTLVLLVQLGSPKSPSVKDVREYLREFLGDPRVVDINPLLWKIILNCFVLPFRPKRSAALYSRIWDGESFPLVTYTNKFAEKVHNFTSDHLEVKSGFLLSYPNFDDLLNYWESHRDDYDRLIVIPQFPQYSESTIAAGYDAWNRSLNNRVVIPSFEFVSHYHRLKSFINLSVRNINDKIKGAQNTDYPIENLVISFHGIPLRRVMDKEDPYFFHCYETYLLIKERVTVISQDNIHLTFQSRFGSEVWLGPYTDEYCVDLISQNKNQTLAVYSPSFVVDCLETTDELGHELKEEVEEEGGKLLFIESLNDDDQWAREYGDYIDKLNKREVDDLFYDHPEGALKKPELSEEDKNRSLPEESKKTLKIVFLTLFLDLIGFSIIFPMFPAMAKYYLEVDKDNFFLSSIFNGIESLLATSDASGFAPIVLFGGVLGALYSILQFFAAPLWGSLSDKYGRKPTLKLSVAGLAISYLLWIFSGSFTLLIIARFIGGIMGGNISIASAVVADITSKENRSKGMAYIGIAFATGFILGPAIGGILSMVNLLDYFPTLSSFGINPFTMPALFAFILSMINLRMIKRSLPETRKKSTNHRVTNPLKLFRPLPFRNVNYTNLSYFFFISAFSGMEFTLTFLAVERLSYTPMQNAYMFIFIGIIIALVQGGFVRRKASEIGEKKLSLLGMILVVPGLLSIGYTSNSFFLYFGLLFLSIGSALIIPCLTALVSIFSPSEEQGRSLGIFRSLGALGRVIGPISASLIYWKAGSSMPYLLGACFIVLPFLILKSVRVEESA